MDKIINNQTAKESTQKAESLVSVWSVCVPDTRYENAEVTGPRGVPVPIQCRGRSRLVEWMAVLHLTADNVWPCGADVSLAQRSKCCSDNRLTHSLLWRSHLHLNTQVLSHSPLPHCEKGADLLCMAGTESCRHSGSSTALSCHSIFYSLLQIRPRCLRKQKEEPAEFPHILRGFPSN